MTEQYGAEFDVFVWAKAHRVRTAALKSDRNRAVHGRHREYVGKRIHDSPFRREATNRAVAQFPSERLAVALHCEFCRTIHSLEGHSDQACGRTSHYGMGQIAETQMWDCSTHKTVIGKKFVSSWRRASSTVVASRIPATALGCSIMPPGLNVSSSWPLYLRKLRASDSAFSPR